MEKDNIRIEELIQQNEQLIGANFQYQQVLERTNSQLGLWGNPYSIMVMVLGIMFTVLTIVATLIIWWQSREHREMIQKELNRFFKEKENSSLDLIKKTTEESEKKLKTARGEQKTELEQKIKDLKSLELQIKTGMPDLSQYMKTDEFICRPCQRKQDQLVGSIDYFSDLASSKYMKRNFDLINRKCLMCGEIF